MYRISAPHISPQVSVWERNLQSRVIFGDLDTKNRLPPTGSSVHVFRARLGALVQKPVWRESIMNARLYTEILTIYVSRR